jgi:hypothetical protein
MNFASLAMALVGLLIWVFFSPHQHAKQGASLDRTRKLLSLPSGGHDSTLNRHVVTRLVGSFFGFQFLGCLLTNIFFNVMTCTTTTTLHRVGLLAYLVVVVGIGNIGAKTLGLDPPPPHTHIATKLSKIRELQAPTFSAIATCWSGQQS